MKTGNLGIYLNFKNLSKTWHVNTNREQIHNGLFLSIHFHLLSNVMCFLWKNWNMRKSPGWAEDNFILNLRRKQFTMWQRHGWRNKFNLSPLLGFSLKRPEPWLSSFLSQWQWTIGDESVISPIFLQTIELSAALDNKKYLEWLFMTTELTEITRRI